MNDCYEFSAKNDQCLIGSRSATGISLFGSISETGISLFGSISETGISLFGSISETKSLRDEV